MFGKAFGVRAHTLAFARGAAVVALVALVVAPCTETVTHASGDNSAGSAAAGSPRPAASDPPPILPVCPLPDWLGSALPP